LGDGLLFSGHFAAMAQIKVMGGLDQSLARLTTLPNIDDRYTHTHWLRQIEHCLAA